MQSDRDRFRPGKLVVTGFVNEAMGLGRAGRMTISALEAAGIEVAPHDIRPVLHRFPRGGLRLPGNGGGVWIIQANAPECDAVLQAVSYDSWRDRYRIGYWVWETTEAPASWAPVADWFHEIWTISQFSADAICAAFSAASREDLKAKVKVMPCPTPHHNGRASHGRFGLHDGTVVALSTFDGRSTMARKNPYGSVAAWIEAFPTPTADALLLIKSIESHVDPDGVDNLRRQIAGRPDIRLFDARLTDAEMNDLIATVDVLLSLHRSEGFGLTISEAMYSGKAVVCSRFGAPTEWLDLDSAVLTPVDVVPVDDPSGAYLIGSWAEPRIPAAAVLLRDLVRAPDVRERMGRNARKRALEFDNYWTSAALANETWAGLCPRRPVPTDR